MSFSTTPFKNYVAGMHEGFLQALREKGPTSPWYEEVPCDLCEGKGFLQGHIQFSKLSDPVNKFSSKSGAPISAPTLIECPKCLSTGADIEKARELMSEGV